MTGGGIYPALAVHQALENKTEATLWVGSENSFEKELLEPYSIDYISIPGSGIHGKDIFRLPKNIVELIRGYKKAKQIINEFKPDVILFTGGYIGVPMVYAASKIPSAVFIPDIEPGLAIKLIMRKANRILISTERSRKYLPNYRNVTVTGYPLRKEIMDWPKTTSREFFGIKPKEKIILVFGGSKGARSINNAIIPHLEDLTNHIHVIHITGTANWDDCKMKVSKMKLSHPEKYHPYPFLHKEMGAAFSASDLVICRAGASIIGELPFFGLPAILIPYPHAWRYQYTNADYLVSHKAALLLNDDEIQEKLFEQITSLITDKEKLNMMKEKMQSLASVDAAGTIASIVCEIGKEVSGGNIL